MTDYKCLHFITSVEPKPLVSTPALLGEQERVRQTMDRGGIGFTPLNVAFVLNPFPRTGEKL